MITPSSPPLVLLEKALTARRSLLDDQHNTALRLFNGYNEGIPGLVIDLYATTVVLHDHRQPTDESRVQLGELQACLLRHYPWLSAIILKQRSSRDAEARRGKMIIGTGTDRKIIENGVWYALDLHLHQDDSFYPDTRTLRSWLKQQLVGKTLLNAFAYTGSLGVAALAGGAERVVQLDQNAHFLDLAAESCRLNNIEVHRSELMAEDFWIQVSRFKRQEALFDCVVLDPPFFATSPRTRLDLNTDSPRLINKVRPLVKHGGWLIAVNNAVFLSGKAYLAQLEGLCRDGYLEIEEFIPIPEDCRGFASTCSGSSRADPAPFNHSTKITVLKARRKGS